MARATWQEVSPWRRRSLTIPPNSVDTWIQLAAWEIWMGMLLCVILTLGVSLIVTSPDRIVSFSDLSHCYAPPPVELPCEEIVYRGGMLDAAFTSLFGVMLLGLAGWLLWDLWSATEPKPISDDFLRLLNESFGRSWRNPFTWPWSRMLWAYGFTIVGAAFTVGVAALVWTLVAAPERATTPASRIETSQTFHLSR